MNQSYLSSANSRAKFKAKLNTMTSGVVNNSIKQTKQWVELYEMSHKTEDIAAFAAALKTATVLIGTVKTLTTMMTIEIFDLKGVSIEDNVYVAHKRDYTTNLDIKRVNLTRVTKDENELQTSSYMKHT